MTMSDEEFEEKQAEVRKLVAGGEDADLDRAVKEKDGWHFGERVAPLEDDEDHSIYSGTEGTLLLFEVGAPEHNNVQVKAYYLEDGMDGYTEVQLDNLESVG